MTKENEVVVKKSEVSSFYIGWSGDRSIEHPLDNLEHPMSLFRKFRQENERNGSSICKTTLPGNKKDLERKTCTQIAMTTVMIIDKTISYISANTCPKVLRSIID